MSPFYLPLSYSTQHSNSLVSLIGPACCTYTLTGDGQSILIDRPNKVPHKSIVLPDAGKYMRQVRCSLPLAFLKIIFPCFVQWGSQEQGFFNVYLEKYVIQRIGNLLTKGGRKKSCSLGTAAVHNTPRVCGRIQTQAHPGFGNVRCDSRAGRFNCWPPRSTLSSFPADPQEEASTGKRAAVGELAWDQGSILALLGYIKEGGLWLIEVPIPET